MRVIASLCLLVVSACSDKDPLNPGTPLGTYHVTGKVSANSCAPLPDPWTFDVKLNKDGTTLYWIQGGVPVSGTLGPDGHVALTSSSSSLIDPGDMKTGQGACTVDRTDALDAVVPTDDPPASFTGTLTYTFSPENGSDCAAHVADFGALPCSVTYALSGARSGK